MKVDAVIVTVILAAIRMGVPIKQKMTVRRYWFTASDGLCRLKWD